MYFYTGILLYVALVDLATNYYYGSHIDEGYDDLTDPYYDNQKIFGRNSICVAEGGDCGEPLSICCSGLRCRHEFWPTGSRCEIKRNFYVEMYCRVVRVPSLRICGSGMESD